MSKNFFGKEKDISEFICYQLKIATHQGGIVWRVVRYAKICPRYNLASIIIFLVHRHLQGGIYCTRKVHKGEGRMEISA